MESKVFNEDCMIGMARYPDKYFDLAIVDPPYGINAESGYGQSNNKNAHNKLKKWDNETPTIIYFNELKRVSVNQIIWGANYFIEMLGSVKGFICWDKQQQGKNFSDCEFAWTSFDKPAKLVTIRYIEPYECNIYNTIKRIHPTQKPIKLYKWILQNYGKRECNHKHTKEYNHLCTECSKPVKILDTHLGSGSSRIAAHEMGFDFTGFELDKDYFEAAEKRYQNHIKQLTMFPH